MVTSPNSTRIRHWAEIGPWLAIAGIGAAASSYVHRLWAMGSALPIRIPIGNDAAMWGLAALEVELGVPTSMPPVHPNLVAALSTPDGLVQGALLLNAMCLAIVPSAAAWAASPPQNPALTRTAAAIAAGLMALGHLHLASYAWYFRPEPLVMVLLTLMFGAVLRFSVRPSLPYAVLVGFLAGLCFDSREHGMVMGTAALLALPFLARGNAKHRSVYLAAALAPAQAVHTFFEPHTFPRPFFLNAQISDKLRITLRDAQSLAQGQDLGRPDMKEMPEEAVQAASEGILALVEVMGKQMLACASPFLAVLLVATALLVLSLRYPRHTLALALGLSPMVPFLFVWTMPRHLLVMAPCAAILAAAAPGLITRGNKGAALLTLAGGIYLAQTGVAEMELEVWQKWSGVQQRVIIDKPWSDLVPRIVARSSSEERLGGAELLAIATGIAPVSGTQRAPLGQLPVPDPGWREQRVAKTAPGTDWEVVEEGNGWSVYRRKRPAGVSERCLYGRWVGPVFFQQVPHDTAPATVEPWPDCPVVTVEKVRGLPGSPTGPIVAPRL